MRLFDLGFIIIKRLHQLTHVFWRSDEVRADPRLTNFDRNTVIREKRRRVNHLSLAVAIRNFVCDRWGCDDKADVRLASQTLGDNLEVEHAKKSATETTTERS